MIRFAATLLFAATVSACALVPRGGPSGRTLAKSELVDHVKVTQDIAMQMAVRAKSRRTAEIDTARMALERDTAFTPAFRFSRGDRFTASLWSFPVSADAVGASSSAPQPSELGRYIVTDDGSAYVPYVGRFAFAGLTLPDAQRQLTRRFASLGMFRRPSVVISVEAAPSNAILVTGAIGNPHLVPWTPGGRTLADTLTEALGANPDILRNDQDGDARAAIAVDVIRGTAPPLSLPIYTALRERVLLQPGDRVIVRKEPAVIVTMLGAGIRQNGRLSFAAPPTLSVALARAGGLDANIAAANGMFVMRQTVNGRPLLYDFSWNRAGGMLAAQQFPLEANDVVYVAEAPILSIQKVVNTLFQLVLPAQLIK